MNGPCITVVIPAFNAEDTLADALESVEAQTWPRVETVVVDDGSQDATREVALQHPRVVYKRQERAGPAAARNTGARRARGQFLAFLDADDLWHPQILRMHLAAFARKPSIGFSSTRAIWLNGKVPVDWGQVHVPTEPRIRYPVRFASFFEDPYVGTPGVMMRKEVFDQHGGFREGLSTSGDIDRWLRVAYEEGWAMIEAPLFARRALPVSASTRAGDDIFRDNLLTIKRFCQEHPEFTASEPTAVRKAKARVYEDWGGAAIGRGDHLHARRLLLRALRYRISTRRLFLLAKAILPVG